MLNRDADMARRLKLQHNMCYYCAVPITMADHLDHVVPVYYGGRSNRANLVASCVNCNLIKGTQQIEITNPYTIHDYQKLIKANNKWQATLKKHPHLKKYQPKLVCLYRVYRADLFSEA